MDKEELLKEIVKLPKVETNNAISCMASINVDDLMNAVDRLNKIPDYNDLLKENQELKIKINNKIDDYKRMKDNFDSKVDVLTEIDTQQKEFIKFLEDNWKETQDIWYIKILQKYKEIIGVSDENNIK